MPDHWKRLTRLAGLWLACSTAVWGQDFSSVPRLANRADWTLTASHGAPHLKLAIDGDIATRYSTIAEMKPGMWLQIALPKPEAVAGLLLDQGRSSGDFPRGYRVELSQDGRAWTSVASGAGTRDQSWIFFEKQPARFIRITQTGEGPYWSIHELHVLTEMDPRIVVFRNIPVKNLAEEVPDVRETDPTFLKPYAGPVERGVDTSTLRGKVMCGYQGWFNCEGDGMQEGWTHWAKHRKRLLGPGNVTVDLWPDLREYEADERYPTGFTHADGRVAEVFSSANRKTVLRHFSWMKQYGIDGAFVQRFANGLRPGSSLVKHKNAVLTHAREGANRNGRAYAVMYDLSGLRQGETERVFHDWRLLRRSMRMGEDSAYLQHEGKPLVAIWGVGFGDDRAYTLAECRDLILALKKDGCAIMLGIPTGWRTLDRDAVSTPALHEVLKLADMISPWTIGRYHDPASATRHGEYNWKPDLAWAQEAELDYLPVVFPGFSWHNLTGERLDSIPRLKGEFLWSQFLAAKAAGAQMVYVAMFDEVDEATAIFKCTNDPPTGEFLTYEGLPSDHYLKLTGKGAQLIRRRE